MLSPRAAFILAIALAAAVFATYSPALNFKFILDDHRFVNDPRVQSPGHLWEYFTSYVWSQFTGGPSSFYRPVFTLVMRLNFILSGMSPWGWHLVSVMTHLLVAGLVGLLGLEAAAGSGCSSNCGDLVCATSRPDRICGVGYRTRSVDDRRRPRHSASLSVV